MRKIRKLVYAFLASICLLATANAIIVNPGVHLSPSGVNVQYTINTTLHLSNIHVESTYIILNNTMIKIIPDAGRMKVNLSVFNIPSYMRFEVNTTGVTSANMTISGLNASEKYYIYVDGNFYKRLYTNASGYLTFEYANFSDHRFFIYGYNPRPYVDFVWSPRYPKPGELIQFKDLSVDLDGTIVSWLWDFGDGETDTLKNPTHRYDRPGVYAVSLTVTDNEGKSSTRSVLLRVYEEEPEEEVEQYTVTLYFTDKHNRAIEGVSVKVYNGSELIFYGSSDEAGRVQFNATGYITLKAEKKGYKTYETEMYVFKDLSLVIRLQEKKGIIGGWWWVAVGAVAIVSVGVYLRRRK